MWHLRLIVWLGLLALISCGGNQESPPDSTFLNDPPSQESWHTTIYINSQGRPTVKAYADYLAGYTERKQVKLIGNVKLDFFNQEGQHVSVLQADTGYVDHKREQFTALGRVEVISDSGATLTTSRLYYNEREGRIFTDDRVRLTTHEDTLYGIGFASDADLTHWTIKNPTGVTYRLSAR